jgi:hypothetical protein
MVGELQPTLTTFRRAPASVASAGATWKSLQDRGASVTLERLMKIKIKNKNVSYGAHGARGDAAYTAYAAPKYFLYCGIVVSGVYNLRF